MQTSPTPHDFEAEKAVLGAGLINNATISSALERVSSDDFFRQVHGRILAVMVELHRSGTPVDLVTLKSELDRRGELDNVGGPAYLSALTDGVPRSLNVEHYARIVHEKAMARRFITQANLAIEHVAGGKLDVGCNV